MYLWSHHLKIITAILKCNRNLLNAKWKVRIPPKLHIFQSLERALCSIVIVNATPEIDRLRVEMVLLFDWQSRSCNIGMRKYQENTTKSTYIRFRNVIYVTRVGKGSSEEKKVQQILIWQFVLEIFMWFKIAKNEIFPWAILEGRWCTGR